MSSTSFAVCGRIQIRLKNGSLFLWRRKFSTGELELGDCHRVTSINKPKGSCQRQMKQEATLIRAQLKTPRAAAIAGILFSVLLITGLLLFHLSVRADPLETGAWLKTSSNKVALAL